MSGSSTPYEPRKIKASDRPAVSVQTLFTVHPCFLDCVRRATQADDDVTGGYAPDKGLLLGVVVIDVVVGLVLEIADAGLAVTTEALSGDHCKEPFRNAKPRRAGRREGQLDVHSSLHLGRNAGHESSRARWIERRFFLTARWIRHRKLRQIGATQVNADLGAFYSSSMPLRDCFGNSMEIIENVHAKPAGIPF